MNSTKKKIVVLSGAGISAESGLSTFRDSNGLWHNHKIEEVATLDAFHKNPAMVLEFYNQRRRALQEVKPNKAHTTLSELEKHFDIQIITQNVDNLHERAGSTKVLHLHGILTKAQSSGPNKTPFNIGYNDIQLGDTCKDGYQIRPFIVWFGEPVPNIIIAERLVQQADIMLVIGTSLNVYPATGLIHNLPLSNKIYLIDNKMVHINRKNVVFIQKNATEGIDDFVKELTF